MRPGRSSSTDCRATESPASCGAFHYRTSAASSAPSSSVPGSRGLNRTQSFGTGGEPPSGGEPSSARIRHQVDCGWAQTPANVSEVRAGARTSQTCAGEGQSHCGVSGRRAGGGDRADPVFHPNNGDAHKFQCPVNSEQFTSATQRRPQTSTRRAEPSPQQAAGWPRAVTHPRLPQIRTCPIKASGSSNNGLAAQRYTLCTTLAKGRGLVASIRVNRSHDIRPLQLRRPSHLRQRRYASHRNRASDAEFPVIP